MRGRGLGDECTALGLGASDLRKLLVWSRSPADGGVGWVLSVGTRGSRGLGLGSRARPTAGLRLWGSLGPAWELPR